MSREPDFGDEAEELDSTDCAGVNGDGGTGTSGAGDWPVSCPLEEAHDSEL
jgi:hypothetical protein